MLSFSTVSLLLVSLFVSCPEQKQCWCDTGQYIWPRPLFHQVPPVLVWGKHYTGILMTVLDSSCCLSAAVINARTLRFWRVHMRPWWRLAVTQQSAAFEGQSNVTQRKHFNSSKSLHYNGTGLIFLAACYTAAQPTEKICTQSLPLSVSLSPPPHTQTYM